jgi:hypothetical protein
MHRRSQISADSDARVATETEMNIENPEYQLALLRQRARRRGILVQKTRKPPSSTNLGGYRILEPRTDRIVAGKNFSLSLPAAVAAVEAEIARFDAKAAALLIKSGEAA